MASRLKRSNWPEWNFFLKNNKIFMCLLAPFILQNFKRIVRADQSYQDVPFLGTKWPICSEQFFFWYKPLLLLSSTCWPFSLCKIYKKLLQLIQSCEDAPVWTQNGPFAPQLFFWKIINIILVWLLAPFIVQDFKKILPADPELWSCAILGHNFCAIFCPNEIF